MMRTSATSVRTGRGGEHVAVGHSMAEGEVPGDQRGDPDSKILVGYIFIWNIE